MQVVVQRLHNTTTPDGLTVSVPATVGQLTAVGHAFRNCLDEQALDYAVRPLRVVTVTDAGDRPVAVGHIHHTPGGRVGLAELLGPENGPVADDVAADIVQHVQAVLADAGPL